MKNLKYILALAAGATLAVSCDDFLEKNPISSASEAGYYTTEEQLLTALPACYSTLYDTYGAEGLMYYFGEIWSDECHTDNTAGQVGDTEAFDTHQGMNTSNSVVENYWEIYYQAIYRMNNIIKNAEGNEGLKSLVGEARFLRGLYYFDMVRMWGEVPLVTTPVSGAEAYGIARSSTSDVYAQIVEDLSYAASNLPDKSKERVAGAATSDAANALLGKVYLTMGQKENAKTALLKVYNSGRFSLCDDYANLWDLSYKNSSESIFEVQYKGGIGNPYSMYWALFSPIDNRVVTAWGGGYNQPEDELYDAYTTNGVVDSRRDKSIQVGYTTADGKYVPTKFTIKWRDDNAEVTGLREASDNNFIILRYADVLLMLTEATGDVSYMNQVQDRAGAARTTTYSVEALLHERQLELAFEYHRMFDLLRLGQAVSVLSNCQKLGTLTFSSDSQFLLPIPQKVIDQNPNVITQNSAY